MGRAPQGEARHYQGGSVTQADKVLAYLQAGHGITPKMAYEMFGCLALHSRIAELRDRGHDIVCTIRTANGKRWGWYHLRAVQLRLVA